VNSVLKVLVAVFSAFFLFLIACYWLLLISWWDVQTPTIQFFFSSLLRLRCPSFFFFLFPFMKWRKDSHRKWKRKMLNWRLAFVILFLSSSTDDGICLPPFFLIVRYFSFPVCSWLEEDYRALYSILIHHHRPFSFVSFYLVLSETSDNRVRLRFLLCVCEREREKLITKILKMKNLRLAQVKVDCLRACMQLILSLTRQTTTSNTINNGQ